MSAQPSGLRFSPGNHRYWLDKKPVPGVTTILGVLNKPALVKWASATVAEYVADNRDAVEHLYAAGRGPMIGALKEVPWQKRDDAADRGHTLHDFAEKILRGVELADDEIGDDLLPVVENAIAFLTDWQIKPLLIEAPCASREHWFAGTLDLIAEYTRPDTGHSGVAIFDWKSGKALYPEYAWQLNAYAHAEFTGLGGDEEPLPATDAAFGVHIRPDGYDVAPFAFGPDIYAEFLIIRRAFDIAKRGRGDWKTPGSGHVGLLIQANTEQDVA